MLWDSLSVAILAQGRFGSRVPISLVGLLASDDGMARNSLQAADERTSGNDGGRGGGILHGWVHQQPLAVGKVKGEHYLSPRCEHKGHDTHTHAVNNRLG